MYISTVKIYPGHVLDQLKKIPDKSVHCIVTSPPYWNLRYYETPDVIWPNIEYRPMVNIKEIMKIPGDLKCNHVWLESKSYANKGSGKYCKKCGIWKGSLGNEPTAEQYIGNILTVCKELYRILRNDGCFYFNIGDTYKNKNLCGIPWRVALALQADNWYLRSEIIWSKVTPLPESVQDRPTKAHEHIFMFTKQEKYYWDHIAVMEDNNAQNTNRYNKVLNTYATENNTIGRHLRDVWHLKPTSVQDAHFAAFPLYIPEKCIKSGTSEYGVCASCGAPYKRLYESAFTEHTGKTQSLYPKGTSAHRIRLLGEKVRENGHEYVNIKTTIGWERTCQCDTNEITQATVLDPFWGAGTTSLVAAQLRRNSIGIELNADYINVGKKRLNKEFGLFINLE